MHYLSINRVKLHDFKKWAKPKAAPGLTQNKSTRIKKYETINKKTQVGYVINISSREYCL